MMPRQRTRPTLIDLFCGAGGLSLGFRAAGCLILSGVDVDETAATTYISNFKKLQRNSPPRVLSSEEGNMEEVDLTAITDGRRPDILIGGPPCQGFSHLGRGKLDSLSEEGFAGDPRNELYRRFLNAVGYWSPLAVVMENVPGMLSVKGRNVADEAAADLAKGGYRVGYAILNAVWYGVPQFRERLFFVGIREDRHLDPTMPTPTHYTRLPAGYAPPEKVNLPLPFMRHFELSVDVARSGLPATTAREALEDLPAISEHLADASQVSRQPSARTCAYRGAPSSRFAQLMRQWPGLRGSGRVRDHVIRRTPRDYETFRRMNAGCRYPEAVAIARSRFQEELDRLAGEGLTPVPGSPEYQELERRFVPPYPVESFLDKWRKLDPGQPSHTVPAHLSKDAYSHIHYDSTQARAISIREAARLQSFPDGFRFAGNMGECYRQIGNAVPPLLAWAIAAELLSGLGFPSMPVPWITD